jgi:hypothetical protein
VKNLFEPLQHKAIFMGEKRREVYKAERGYFNNTWQAWVSPSIYETTRHIDYEKIVEVDLDNPPLKVDDYIFINKLNKKYKVCSVARSTNNEHIYYVDYIFETIIDNETELSKKTAEELLEKFQQEQHEKEEQLRNKLKEKFKPKKKWYQFWK